MRCEERYRCISPIVNAARRAILRIELEHGKEFDSSDAQVMEIASLLDESAVCAAYIFCDAGAWMPCESFYMHFVHDSLRRWPSERCIALPVIRGRTYNHALHRGRSVVAFFLGQLTRIVFPNSNSATIGVEQDLGRIKTQSFGRVERPV